MLETLHFDARFIRIDRHDGISRFSAELIKALAGKIRVVVIIHDLRQLESLPNNIEYILLNNPQSITEFFVARKLNRVGATHVFSPMQIMGSFGRKYKLILTLHDLIYYRHRKPPQDLNFLIRGLWRLYHLSYQPQRWLLNRADAVATVSKTTKSLIRDHRLTKRPVTVVYNAPEKLSAIAPRAFPKTKDLLYIGSFMPYKNVETLVRGAGLLPGYKLHLLSKITPVRKAQLAELAANSGAELVFHEGVSDQEYKDLLSSAFALVSASKDEGFGIPLVEAMQLGTPVVVSKLDIFSEVSGAAGTYFSTDSPQEFAQAVKNLEDQNTWLAKSKSSISQANTFDWNKSAEALIQAFGKLDS
jgi:glycosyltransferase involved in cell wall biosynthesis